MKFVHENFYITHVMIIFIQHKLKKNVSLARFVYSIYRNISGLYDNQSHRQFIEIKTQEGICHPYKKNCCMLAQKYVYSLQSHVTITYSKGTQIFHVKRNVHCSVRNEFNISEIDCLVWITYKHISIYQYLICLCLYSNGVIRHILLTLPHTCSLTPLCFCVGYCDIAVYSWGRRGEDQLHQLVLLPEQPRPLWGGGQQSQAHQGLLHPPPGLPQPDPLHTRTF